MTPSTAPRPGPRALVLTTIIGAATLYFLHKVQPHYAITRWLFWRYLWAWLCAGLWGLSCLAAGHEALGKLRLRGLLLGERVALSFALGVLLFGLSIFALGLLHLLWWPLFFALPASMLLASRGSLRFGRRALRLLSLARRRSPGPPAWQIGLWGAGALGVLLLYAQTLSPEALNYDSRWYHLPLAEHYAAAHAVERSPEGWFLAAYPHLTSYLFTWCFLRPLAPLFDHVILCSHVEFVIFLFTLAAIPPVVRRLVPGARARGAWVGLLLFPGVFLYDSNLNGGADHVAALWAIPAWLCWRRVAADLCPRWSALLAAYLSAMALTKYSALALFAAIGALTLLAQARAALRGKTAEALRSLGWLVVVGATLTSVHWLKNWFFYGDPAYPLMHQTLQLDPWTADAPGVLAQFNGLRPETKKGVEGLIEAARVVFTFSFEPHDWKVFHGTVPVFGSLFSLSMLFLPVLPGRRALLPLYAACSLGVALWYLLYPYDRYLQALLPLMAAGTVGASLLVWREHWLPRAALALLVGFQVVWGGDTPFIATHNQIEGGSSLRASIQLLESGFKKASHRLQFFAPWPEIGAHLPPGARLLVHESPHHLGVRAPTVNDQWQGGLSYRELGSPSAIHRKLREMKVTHIAWERERSHLHDTLAGDLLFFEFATRHGVDRQPFGLFDLALVPEIAPDDAAFIDKVAVFGCNKPYKTGLYRLTDLAVPPLGGPSPAPLRALGSKPYDLALLASQVGFIVLDTHCHPLPPAGLEDHFALSVWRGDDRIYLRR